MLFSLGQNLIFIFGPSQCFSFVTNFKGTKFNQADSKNSRDIVHHKFSKQDLFFLVLGQRPRRHFYPSRSCQIFASHKFYDVISMTDTDWPWKCTEAIEWQDPRNFLHFYSAHKILNGFAPVVISFPADFKLDRLNTLKCLVVIVFRPSFLHKMHLNWPELGSKSLHIYPSNNEA